MGKRGEKGRVRPECVCVGGREETPDGGIGKARRCGGDTRRVWGKGEDWGRVIGVS